MQHLYRTRRKISSNLLPRRLATSAQRLRAILTSSGASIWGITPTTTRNACSQEFGLEKKQEAGKADAMVILSVAGLSLIVSSYVFFVLAAVSPQPSQPAWPPANPHGATVGNFQGSAIGNPAPDFSLADMQGKTVTLSAMKGKTVVLFFNEGSMCYPSCWN